MNPGSDIGNGCESSVTGRLPRASNLTTSRRVGSASAAKTASSGSSVYLTIRFSIIGNDGLVKHELGSEVWVWGLGLSPGAASASARAAARVRRPTR